MTPILSKKLRAKMFKLKIQVDNVCLGYNLFLLGEFRGTGHCNVILGPHAVISVLSEVGI